MPAFFLNRARFYSALFFLVPLLIFSATPASTEDLCVWVAQGLRMVQSGSLLTVDPYSVLPTAPLVYPAGISYFYGWLDFLGGLPLLVVFHRAVMLVTLVLLYRAVLLPLKNPWAGKNPLWVALCLMGCIFGFVERPSLVAELPFLFCFLLLEREHRLKPSEIACLWAAELFWVNVHGSFILLPILWGWRIAGRAFEQSLGWRRQGPGRLELWCWLGSWLVPLANPFGWRVYPYVWETATLSMQRMEEWQVTSITAYFPQGVLFFLLAALVIYILYKKYLGKPFPFSSAYLPLMILGFTAIRHTDLVFLATLPFLARIGCLREDPQAGEPRLLNGILVGGMAALCVAFSPWTKPFFAFILPDRLRPVFSGTAPFSLAEVLTQDPIPGAVFNQLDFGSFLTYAQKRKIFLDSRNIIFSDDSVRAYFRVLEARPGWEKVLDEFGVRYALLKPQNEALLSALRTQGWQEAGKTQDAVLLRKP